MDAIEAMVHSLLNLGEGLMTNLRRWIVRLLVCLMVLIPLGVIGLYLANPFGARSYDPRQRILGYSPYRVPSRSMAPTVSSDQIVIMSAGHYRKREPQRGDIVVFLASHDGNAWIKRVVGLPGEAIAIKKGELFIDGEMVDEEYVAAANEVTDYSQEMSMRKLGKDSYFLLGDNRDNSEDSRMMGTTKRDDIIGKVVVILN